MVVQQSAVPGNPLVTGPAAAPACRNTVPVSNMTTDDPAGYVLMALLAELEAFAETNSTAYDGADHYLMAIREKGIPYQPNIWQGRRLETAERQRYSRAARRLEQAALLRRITGPRHSRTTYLQPTAAGLRRALELVDARADQNTIAEGLRRMNWGKELVPLVTTDQPRASA